MGGFLRAELVDDPLQPRGISSTGEKTKRTPATLFTFVPSEFLHRAQDRPPKDAQPTASAFSQWVYSLYGNMEGGDEDRERGLEAEKEIWKLRGAASGANGNEFLKRMGSPCSAFPSFTQARKHLKTLDFRVRAPDSAG